MSVFLFVYIRIPFMQELSLSHRVRRFWNKFRVLGFKQAFRSVTGLFKPGKDLDFPLASADPDLILAADVTALRDFARRKKVLAKGEVHSKNIENHFPYVFNTQTGKSIRYAFFPALESSKGLVVVFHGYLGFEIYSIRYSWREFDLLLPLDNFGWKNLGSWFWGEKGNNHVELLTEALIQKIRSDLRSSRWFTIGASMGGFAALYHGIKYSADGIYVTTPIIDLKSKIKDYQSRNIQTAYTEVAAPEDTDLSLVPDIHSTAQQAQTLPPLFLVQNQYDRSNPFGEYTLPLLSIYHQKKAWAGLRVHPAIGHQGHDGSYQEAQYFFDIIATKSPPRVVDFYDKE